MCVRRGKKGVRNVWEKRKVRNKECAGEEERKE